MCLRMDWNGPVKLYVMEKHSLLIRLRMKKEPAVPLENNQASIILFLLLTRGALKCYQLIL